MRIATFGQGEQLFRYVIQRFVSHSKAIDTEDGICRCRVSGDPVARRWMKVLDCIETVAEKVSTDHRS